MKILLTGSTILMLIFFTSLEGGLSSCTKDNTIYDTVTVIHKDTVTVIQKDTLIIKDTVLTAEILTANSWKVQELRGVLEGAIMYYLRGGSSNTQSFDNEYITFNADNTGLLLDNAGYSHAMTNWHFGNAGHTQLIFTLYNDAIVTSVYTWDNIRFKNGSLYYDDYFTDNLISSDYHGQEIRIPK